MGFRTLASAAAVVVVATFASAAANAAPLPTGAVRTNGFTIIEKIGYRHHEHDAYHGGIRYDGPYGLTYAPSFWRDRHHGEEINVNVYIGPRERDAYRQRARPLIIDLRR